MVQDRYNVRTLNYGDVTVNLNQVAFVQKNRMATILHMSSGVKLHVTHDKSIEYIEAYMLST